jgi:hypothetical protein
MQETIVDEEARLMLLRTLAKIRDLDLPGVPYSEMRQDAEHAGGIEMMDTAVRECERMGFLTRSYFPDNREWQDRYGYVATITDAGYAMIKQYDAAEHGPPRIVR